MSSYSLANGLLGTGGINLVGLDGSCGAASFDIPISQLGRQRIAATSEPTPVGMSCQASPFPRYSPQVQQTVILSLVGGKAAPPPCGCGSRTTQSVAGGAGCQKEKIDATHAQELAVAAALAAGQSSTAPLT
jgi:hypothetical protein